MTLHNIAKYKRAKVIVKDLEKALKVITATETSLKGLEHYRPVAYILTTILENKPYIEIFLNQHRIIVETKGAKEF